ncbi:MAG: hypothetical protein M3N49_00005, partial [Candidatus Eremiobacteraeota bacterium]|nr:hypothetical protein [Candidatus Eremiobacteraeota bacterium]
MDVRKMSFWWTGSSANSTDCGNRTRVCAKRASARCTAANDGMMRSRIRGASRGVRPLAPDLGQRLR